MPKALEEKLTKEASSQHLKGKAAKAYIFGTMRKTGWTPGQDKPAGVKKNGEP